MRSLVAVAATLAALHAAPARAQEHLLTQNAVQARLARAESSRQADRARLQRVLATARAAQAAAALGADVRDVRLALAALSDEELRELAARAAALEGDPVAGLDPDVKELLVIFLIVAIVILVLQAVD